MPVRVNRDAARSTPRHGLRPAWPALLGLLLAGAGPRGCMPSAAAAPPPARADLVLLHGRIITEDSADTIAAALAVRAGRIIAVGSDAQILALAGHDTRRIDLRGRAATPGLIDSHAHVADGGLDELFHLRLADASSIAEIRRRLRAAVAVLPAGQWVQGAGWDEAKLREGRYPSAADLDAVAPRNPVWLVQTTGHYGVANSAALRLAGIVRGTADPAAGTIDKDAGGMPTGVLKESAQGLVERLIPPPTPAQRRAGILHALRTLHRAGITAYKDPAIDRPVWEAYRALLEAGRLDEHVCVLWYAGVTLQSARAALTEIMALPRPPQGFGDDRLLSCGAKIFMDGSGGARTAWLYQDWNRGFAHVDTGNSGYPATDPAVYREMVRLFQHAGVHVGTHAIGDRAIDWVVDTYALALEESPAQGLRHSIIHANLPSEHALEVMARLQGAYDAGYPEVQPPFLWWIGDNYAGNFGPQRAPHLIPLQSFQAHGILWSGGSDYPVTPVEARYGLWAAVAREPLRGTYGTRPFGTAEAADVRTALRAYTAWAARQLFLETRIGSLEVGKDADLAVWSADPLRIQTRALRALTCELTLVRGKVVYARHP